MEHSCYIQTNIDDVERKRRYTWNILQPSKNDFKSMIYTNGDYYTTSGSCGAKIKNKKLIFALWLMQLLGATNWIKVKVNYWIIGSEMRYLRIKSEWETIPLKFNFDVKLILFTKFVQLQKLNFIWHYLIFRKPIFSKSYFVNPSIKPQNVLGLIAHAGSKRRNVRARWFLIWFDLI